MCLDWCVESEGTGTCVLLEDEGVRILLFGILGCGLMFEARGAERFAIVIVEGCGDVVDADGGHDWYVEGV